MLRLNNRLRLGVQSGQLNPFNQQRQTLRMPSNKGMQTDELMNDRLMRSANLNKRFSRTKIGCVLLNRIYSRVEHYRTENQLSHLIIDNHLVRKIRHKFFKKFHNLVILGALDTRQIKLLLRHPFVKRKQMNPEMTEFIYQITQLGIKKAELLKFGLYYDESGCPKYGKWRNSLFPNITKSQVAWSRFYRLLDAKMNRPKLCFDFSSLHLKSARQKCQAFYDLRNVFAHNYKSRTPFNLCFTNYRHEYDLPLRQILLDRKLPHFVDLRIDEFGDDLFTKNQKLIVIMKDADKTIERFDHTANYLVPVTVGKENPMSYPHDFIERLTDAPNVELVCLPFKDDLLGTKKRTNLLLHYRLLVSLQNGSHLEESLVKAANPSSQMD